MRLCGKEETLASLDAAVRAATAGHLDPEHPADIAVLGLAGSEFSDVQAEIHRWVDDCGLCRQVRIVNDADPVLAAGTPERWGVALVVGTGSIAIGVDQSGRRLARGGWGHWYGDRGSGYDLGCRALGAVSEAEDGMGPETELTARMLEHFGLENPRLIIQKLYAAAKNRPSSKAVWRFNMKYTARPSLWAIRTLPLPLPCFFSIASTISSTVVLS